MSEEIALAAADLATAQRLHARVRELEQINDRLESLFLVYHQALEHAQALAQAVQAYRTAIDTLNGISAAESALWAALEHYEQATKED